MIIEAPFSDKQIQCINTYQNSNFHHPFTCECNRKLKADNKGLFCTKCSYKQGWVHDFMAEFKATYCVCGVEKHHAFNSCFDCLTKEKQKIYGSLISTGSNPIKQQISKINKIGFDF